MFKQSLKAFNAVSLAIGCLLAMLPLHAVAAEVDYQRDVQPLLARRCGKCHRADVRKGDLNLASLKGIAAGGESGDPLIADKLDDSYLWTMIDGGDMPPKGEPRLTHSETALLRKWIEQGPPAASLETAKVTQHDVLPILLLRCNTCHGRRLKQGKLDLHTIAALRKGGVSGPAMKPGDAAGSLMIKRIESQACPPRDLLLKFFVRRPSTSEVDTLRSWIDNGAVESPIKPDVATSAPDPLVTAADRQHWAFQPPTTTPGRHSIDAFISSKLNKHGLKLAPEADRDTLIRRAYFDLTGMPPSLQEWKKWRTHTSGNWYAALIDHLLASPRYGERWGRYWLDAAGYADSEGGVSSDPVRRVAWKYRDYVIAAFNKDKPYNQFLLEQIAGDELIDYQRTRPVTPAMVDNLVATGFLRMSIDQTGSRTMNFTPERLGVTADAINVMGSAVMGLTLGCAKCHSHKYDPIPHRDYYRFKAIFQGALDEHDWLTFKNRTLNIATPQHIQRVAATNPPLERKVKQLQSQLKKATTALQLETLKQHYPAQTEADRNATIRALRIADNTRSQPQRVLVEMLQAAGAIAEHEQPAPVLKKRQEAKAIETSIRHTRRQMQPPVTIRALWDRGEPSPTYILRRGEHDKPGRLVGPGVPSVLTNGSTPLVVKAPFPGKTGRRLALAKWLTQPRHPLTARVMVNRIWRRHFGEGLVKTVENFGRQGARPAHPELLDWLAIEFESNGWSIKQMHRLMMNSRVYKQSSQINKRSLQLDPQNRLLSHMPMRRLNAEALRDALLAVAGKLDTTPGGPPDAVAVGREGSINAIPNSAGNYRRSVYLQFRRTELPTMLDTFDYPEMGPNCVSRNISTVSPQSLMLLNNRRVRELAAAFAARIDRLLRKNSGGDYTHAEAIYTAYAMALSRKPTAEELQIGASMLNKLGARWRNGKLQSLEVYCHTLMNSAAFIYVD